MDVRGSGKGQSFGQSDPEPGLCAGPGVVTHCQEAQNAGKWPLHGLVDHRNQTLGPGAYTSKVGQEVVSSYRKFL